jgi:hypothetical protein
MIDWRIVEKANHLHLHALCSTRESAQRWIDVNAVEYCRRGYFMDKTLTPESFEILPPKGKQ